MSYLSRPNPSLFKFLKMFLNRDRIILLLLLTLPFNHQIHIMYISSNPPQALSSWPPICLWVLLLHIHTHICVCTNKYSLLILFLWLVFWIFCHINGNVTHATSLNYTSFHMLPYFQMHGKKSTPQNGISIELNIMVEGKEKMLENLILI